MSDPKPTRVELDLRAAAVVRRLRQEGDPQLAAEYAKQAGLVVTVTYMRSKLRWRKLCEQCGEPFLAFRKDARRCSGRCRVRAHRAPRPA